MARRTVNRRKKLGVSQPDVGAGRRAVGYARVSTDKQADQGVSLEMQRSKIETYCELHELELVAMLVDDGESGKDLERPQVQELLRIIRAGEANAVVVYKLDRLTRAPRDLYMLVDDVFNPRGIDLHSVSEHIDSRTPTGRAMMGLMGVFAQMEREVIGQRTREALQHKKRIGERLGTTPLGFRTPGEGQPMVPDEDELRTVRRLLELCEGDTPFTHVARRLQAEGYRTKRGRPWRSATVRLVWLARERYRGLLGPDSDRLTADEEARFPPDIKAAS